MFDNGLTFSPEKALTMLFSCDHMLEMIFFQVLDF